MNQDTMDTIYAMPENRSDEDGAAADTIRRYVAFISDGLSYVISAEYVMEIITNYAITHLPMVPSYISGIINLRGQIIPIIDVRRRMGKAPSDSENNCIIVLDVDGVTLGVTVDTVTKALDIDEAQIAPMPSGNREKLVNGILTTPSGETVLFFDCRTLVDSY